MAKNYFASAEIEREESASKGDENPNDVCVIDINRVVSDINATLKSLGPPLSLECCIYMVPKSLRRVNESAYTPQVVSIGPLHHGKTTLKKMKRHKLRYLDEFLERAVESASLEDFVCNIKKWESRIRCCYAETFDRLLSDEFVKMILVDAGFIFELFLRDYFPDLRDLNDSILYKPCLKHDIQQDLILLENQLPFFVLEGLYDLAFSSCSNNFPSFLELTSSYFSRYNKQKKSIEQKVKHFTDLLRYFQLPAPQKDDNNDYFPNHIRSATELYEVGVRFEVSSSNYLLDINFSDGVLTIPFLKLTDDIESYILNLMALEQCHYPDETYICNRVSVMDNLINTAKDVDLLVRKKIIVNSLGNQVPVATLFNKLDINICRVIDSRTIRLRKDLDAHCGVRYHRWKAILRHEYFSTPWRITSIIVAFILLVVTLIQAICAIISL